MAGAGYKLFATGDVLSASDVNTYMMQQTVMVFANASARTSALSAVLSEGMVSYLQDTNALEVYDGSAWVGATGDITGLTASTGISITSATGPVPTVAIDTAVVPQLSAVNTFTGQNIINAAGTSTVDLIVRATASQTADLQQWQNSGGTSVIYISSSGRLGLSIISSIANTGAYLDTGLVSNSLALVQRVTTAVGFIVRGAASQTANLQEWQNSAGTVNAYVNASGDIKGRLIYAFTTANLSASVNVGTASTGSKGIVVAGQSGQTANLTEWQNSAGTALALVDSAGQVRGGALGINGTAGGIAYARISNASADTTSTTLAVRAVASQTANLQEWQNSAGTVLAKVDFGGFFTAPAFSTGNSLATIFEESSGGRLRLTKATAVMSNPGSNIAKIYLRDGTTAGTLKLVVRAGASGAETTILDNIPQ